MDPRAKTPLPGLTQQFTLSKALYDGIGETQTALSQLRALRERVHALQDKAGSSAAGPALAEFDKKATALEGAPRGGPLGAGSGRAAGGDRDTLTGMAGSLASLMAVLQGADATPTSQLTAAVAGARQALAKLMTRWTALRTQDLSSLNSRLRESNLAVIAVGR
jgi:hypothetical protein